MLEENKNLDIITEQQSKRNNELSQLNSKKRVLINELKSSLLEKLQLKEEKAKIYKLKGDNIAEYETDVRQTQKSIASMKWMGKNFNNKKQSSYCPMLKELRNQIQELKGNIRVFCRIRPVIPDMDDPTDAAGQNGVDETICVHNIHKIEILKPPEPNKDFKKLKTQNTYDKAQGFTFDAVFGCSSTQQDIFTEVYDLVVSALDGYKVGIFAYGQTGSGKTYTMEGIYDDELHKGIIPRSVETLFQIIETRKQEGWTFEIEGNFQEIFCNEVRDLLKVNNSMKQLNKACTYAVTTITVTSAEDILFLLKQAQENRSVGETSSNSRSSRSHSLFQLIINSQHDKFEGGVKNEGAINLIDLAGSERIHRMGTDNSDQRLYESREINKSLSALKDVISGLIK